jgi:hypothetical protein
VSGPGDESWRGVRWAHVANGVCTRHGVEAGAFTDICCECHAEQLDAARHGSREHERPVERDEAGTNSFVAEAPDGTLPLFTLAEGSPGPESHADARPEGSMPLEPHAGKAGINCYELVRRLTWHNMKEVTT